MTGVRTESGKRLLLAYAESSGDLVKPLWRAFEAAGFRIEIAPDNKPPANDAIDSAHAVVVCWTPAAVASDVVNLQAARAQKARKLAPILLAPCTPPGSLGGRFRLADLSSWRGDATDKEFITLVQVLHGKLSGRLFSSGFWRSPYLSWGGVGAVTLGAVALIANFGDLRQTVDGFVNPGASEAALNETDAKVTEVLDLLKGKNGLPLEAGTEAALRESVVRLLSAQSGARREAAKKLQEGDIEGALESLGALASEGEQAAQDLAETYKEMGALAFANRTFDAIASYERATQLAPLDPDARFALAYLYTRTGNFVEAEKAFEFIRMNTDDRVLEATAMGNLGNLALQRSDYKQARFWLNQALELDIELGQIAGQADDLGDLGDIELAEGNVRKGMEFYNRAYQLQIQAGNQEGQAIALLRLGGAALDRGSYADAKTSFETARAIGQRIQTLEHEAAALGGLGDIERNQGRDAAAKALYEQALGIAQSISASGVEAPMHENLGDIAMRAGDKTRAINHFRTARDLYRGMQKSDDTSAIEQKLKDAGATPSPDGPEN